MVMPLGHRVPLDTRIARRTRRTPTGCLEWTSYIASHGYPMLNIDGSMRRASRVLWAAAHGAIPDGLLVMHTCDNPACVEIAHLKLGTHKDNTQDMLAKGRGAKGERAGAAKLTQAAVADIRTSGSSTAELSAKYSISKSQIRRVKNGDYWRNV